MAKEPKSLFRKLTQLFRSGPIVRRKIRALDTATAMADKTKSSGTLLFQKSLSPTYSSITSNAYNLNERMMRYQDFCEMEYTPEIAAALDIYADETCAQDEKGRVLHVYSDNEKIKEILEDLFYDTLNVEFNMRSWVRNLVKYGDVFVYNDVSPEHGVVNAFPIPVNEIEREENYDKDDPFAVRYRWVTMGNRTLENWEISHFRLLGNDMFLPYGSSVIEPARRIWRQLILIEDAMLVYRVVRAPERRVFYIDVANIPPENVQAYVEEQRKRLRTNQVVDNNTGRVDLRYNPMSVDEDFIIPVRGGDSGTKIDTLAGGQNTAAVEDVAYIQKKLFAALKIPRAYLGYDELLCLTGDTRIPILGSNGVMTMENLVSAFSDKDRKEDLYVYSCDDKGKVVPGKVIDAWETKKIDSYYEVTLDSGGKIRCTPNHPFMLRDGTYCRADELKSGQSLMPLYRKLSSKKERDFQDGYEKVLDNSTGNWNFTHRIVNEQGLVKSHPSRLEEKSYVVHHVDHNKLNNHPNNLVKMGKKAHALHHMCMGDNLLSEASRNKLRETMKTSKYLQKHKKGVQKAWNDDDGTRSASVAAFNSKYKRTKITIEELAVIASTSRGTSEFYEKSGLSQCGANNVIKRSGNDVKRWLHEKINLNASIEDLKNYIVNNKIDDLTVLRKHPLPENCPMSWGVANRVVRSSGYKSLAEFKTKELNHNHKVVSVELIKLNEPVSVYDITVEGFHNFAVQGENDGTTAEGGYENCVIVSNSSKATLAQEDIRFSRTINVIQKTMLAELNKLAIIHLYANGFEDDDLQNFVLRLSNPSTVAQQQKLELWRAKFEIGGSLPENMGSAEFVQKEIWGLSKEEIDQINKQRFTEKTINAQLEGITAESIGGGDDSEGGDLGGGDDIFGDMGNDSGEGGEEPDVGGSEDEGLPPEENAGEEPEEEVEQGVELLTSSEDYDDDEDFALKLSFEGDGQRPIKPISQLKHSLYNRGRKRTHGASKTHIPDFEKMTASDSKSLNDPNDTNFLKALVSNPMGEVRIRSKNLFNGLSPHVWSTLKNMSNSEKFIAVNRKTKIMSESVNDSMFEIEIDSEDE